MKKSRARFHIRGAAFVEAILITVVFLMIIAAFIFFFWRFYLYQLILEASSWGLRKTIVESGFDYSTWGTYEDFNLTAEGEINNKLIEYGVQQFLSTNPVVTVCYDSASQRCNARAGIFWRVPCDFCTILSLPIQGVVSFQMPVEDPCFVAGSEGCPGVQRDGLNCP